MHVLPLFTELPAILLDQADHKTASILSIIGVIILLIQLDHKLRVCPECVCKEKSSTKRRTPVTPPIGKGAAEEPQGTAGGGVGGFV